MPRRTDRSSTSQALFDEYLLSSASRRSLNRAAGGRSVYASGFGTSRRLQEHHHRQAEYERLQCARTPAVEPVDEDRTTRGKRRRVPRRRTLYGTR